MASSWLQARQCAARASDFVVDGRWPLVCASVAWDDLLVATPSNERRPASGRVPGASVSLNDERELCSKAAALGKRLGDVQTAPHDVARFAHAAGLVLWWCSVSGDERARGQGMEILQQGRDCSVLKAEPSTDALLRLDLDAIGCARPNCARDTACSADPFKTFAQVAIRLTSEGWANRTREDAEGCLAVIIERCATAFDIDVLQHRVNAIKDLTRTTVVQDATAAAARLVEDRRHQATMEHQRELCRRPRIRLKPTPL
jgi:hypothetical protein